MTQTSFDNYKLWMKYRHFNLCNTLTSRYSAYHGKISDIEAKLSILDYWIDILDWYTLEAEQSDDTLYVSYLPPDEMRMVSELVNQLLGDSFKVDFLLTSTDQFPPIEAPPTSSSQQYSAILSTYTQ